MMGVHLWPCRWVMGLSLHVPTAPLALLSYPAVPYTMGPPKCGFGH